MDVSERCSVCGGPIYRDGGGTIRCLAFAPQDVKERVEAGTYPAPPPTRGAVDAERIAAGLAQMYVLHPGVDEPEPVNMRELVEVVLRAAEPATHALSGKVLP